MLDVNIAVAAEESAGIQTLRLLSQLDVQVVAVLTSGGHGQMRGPSVASVAETFGYPIWPARSVKRPELADRLRAQQVDLLLNVHSLYIVRDEVLQAPRIGSFNLHPGPLPELAGMNAPSWAIYEGRTLHGVTLHGMAAGIDTGPIAYEAQFELSPSETGLSAFTKCVKQGLPLVRQLVETAAAEPQAIPMRRQDLTRRKYHGFEVPHEGKICWALPAARIDAFVRASYFAPFKSPWGIPQARLENEPIGILRTAPTGLFCGEPPGTVDELDDGRLAVATGHGWLAIEQVERQGKFLPAGNVLSPGQRLQDALAAV